MYVQGDVEDPKRILIYASSKSSSSSRSKSSSPTICKTSSITSRRPRVLRAIVLGANDDDNGDNGLLIDDSSKLFGKRSAEKRPAGEDPMQMALLQEDMVEIDFCWKGNW